MTDPTGLRAIFFDIDDTMFSTTPFVQRARERAIQAMVERGLDLPVEKVLEELQAVVEEFGSNDTRHYDRLLKRLPKKATAGSNPDLLVTAGVIAYHETKWRELRIRDEARALLEDLRQTDLKLGVISAGLARKQMEKILRLGLDSYISPHLILITDQVGVAKSNPKLYRMAARRAQVRPAQAMHVGDHPLRDIESAKRAGMKAVWHHGAGKYASLAPSRKPDHEIDSLEELRPILAEVYGVLK